MIQRATVAEMKIEAASPACSICSPTRSRSRLARELQRPLPLLEFDANPEQIEALLLEIQIRDTNQSPAVS